MEDNGHIIVCGFGHLGRRIAEHLRERGCQVTVINKDVDSFVRKRAESTGCALIQGDIRDDDVLELAGIRSAACFIAATGDDRANLEAALSARQMNSKIRIILRIFDQSLARRIENTVDVHALSASFLASPAYVSAAIDDSVASLFNIEGCCLSLSCAGCKSKAGKRGAGKLRVVKEENDLHITTGEKHSCTGSCLVASIWRDSDTPVRYRRKKRVLTLGMRIGRILSYLHPARLFREVTNAWRNAAAVSRQLLVALVVIGILNILVFSTIGKMNLLDAVYFVVVTMTTSGYEGFDLKDASLALRIYEIFAIVVGAALMATIYAIIAEYVLAVRIDYLLGRREVLLRDHTVVVGLGNVGYRVARDLRMLGVEVVAIEANEDSDNVSSARTVFPVITGDASRSGILQKAGVDRAAAILALTDDAMLNLSVALQARESNPHIKTVVRTYELDLADKLKNFGLDEVISTSSIASPAFVDAALYAGVQGSFRCGDGDVLVAKHMVTDSSPFCGKSVAEISEESGIAVVLVSSSERSPYSLASPDKRLIGGERIVILLTREKIGSFMQQSLLPAASNYHVLTEN